VAKQVEANDNRRESSVAGQGWGTEHGSVFSHSVAGDSKSKEDCAHRSRRPLPFKIATGGLKMRSAR
jgi:hypothetical protein